MNNGGTFVFDYWFGLTLANLYSHVPENENQEMSINLYRSSYEKLSEMFDIETCNVSGIIEGITPEKDTVLLTRKK